MPYSPLAAREFALEVVRVLRGKGHAALWAGGCVRDQLLGQTPKDYDVATDATPERIREIFGKRRTLPIGAAFGVITVLGPQAAGQLDVVTFRSDATYSDGRHPDAVMFGDAEHDAQRRDFTINGLFYDPLANRVLDYVGGEQDLKRRVVRAIGDARARIAEDKLRMLRAVRFAARFDFAIEAETLAAIREQAGTLVIVSAERIATELRLILTHPSRRLGVHLLAETGLLPVILPECQHLVGHKIAWSQTLEILDRLPTPTFAMALAALVREIQTALPASDLAEQLFVRWKLSTDERVGVRKLLREEPLIRQARQLPWPRLQRILVAPRCDELLPFAETVASVVAGTTDEIAFCRDKLALPRQELDPPPLITGETLQEIGVPRGPVYRELLEAIRDAQLNGEIATPEAAISRVQQLLAASNFTVDDSRGS